MAAQYILEEKVPRGQAQVPTQTWAFGQEAQVQRAIEVREGVLKNEIAEQVTAIHQSQSIQEHQVLQQYSQPTTYISGNFEQIQEEQAQKLLQHQQQIDQLAQYEQDFQAQQVEQLKRIQDIMQKGESVLQQKQELAAQVGDQSYAAQAARSLVYMARVAKSSPARRPPRPAATKKKTAASPPKAPPTGPLSQQQQRIDKRFQAIFGGQFQGHHQYVHKKLLRLKQQLQLQDSKRPGRALLEDFHEIDAYRCITNLRVCDAIRRGVFQEVQTLD